MQVSIFIYHIGWKHVEFKPAPRLTRYCSRECQKSAWKAGHKLSCGRASGTDQPGSPALSKWVEEWKGALMSWSCWAMDLTNHPRDRLASHMLVLLTVVAIFALICFIASSSASNLALTHRTARSHIERVSAIFSRY